MNNADFLKNVPLFAGLAPRHIKNLASSCTERSFSTGEVIVRQGNPGVGLFVVVSGRVKIVKTTESGNEIDIAEHGPGEVVGEMSVLDGATRTASVVAVEDTRCLVLASWAFNSFLQNHPEVALEILPVVVRRFRETNEALLKLKGEA